MIVTKKMQHLFKKKKKKSTFFLSSSRCLALLLRTQRTQTVFPPQVVGMFMLYIKCIQEQIRVFFEQSFQVSLPLQQRDSGNNLSPWTCLFCTFYTNATAQLATFYVWLLPFSLVFLRFSHVKEYSAPYLFASSTMIQASGILIKHK